MSDNLTFIMFCARILSFRILERNGNQETFRQFLHQHDDADVAGLAGPTLVMDNVGFHKTEIVREELIILDLSVKYLQAYSPFFNPIENMFSKWNFFVMRAQAKNEVELLAAMNGVRTVITAEDCNNYCTRVNTNCNNCAHHNVEYFDK